MKTIGTVSRTSTAAAWITAATMLLAGGVATAGSLNATDYQNPRVLLHNIEHEVDHAWEVYHRAALGGTIASPSIQVAIEQDLHMARTLLAQAQEAAEQADTTQVHILATQIGRHTTRAIVASREHKR